MESLTMIQAAFGFMGFDILTGVTAAFYHHELNSRAAREGMYNKCGWSLLIIFSIFLAYITPTITLGEIYIPSIEAVCGVVYFIEFQSIIENICRLLPDDYARRVLAVFHLNSKKFYYIDGEYEGEADYLGSLEDPKE